ncbi:flagellar basal body protein [Aestuariivita sp.]|uniref:flagellar basal body protein n=1 Tax=Aestuariivita sp. TaxID=1872407 RepID=UPI00216D5053|nr:flagellar basal body protein [Aestuariivita sp.]MCE8008983.1 flagellar basal body rod protein [Aestuariivita sp.]
MNLDKVNLFDLASKRLQWVSDRQRTISENIANADVAGYRAREVESFESYLERAQKTASLPSARVEQSQTTWNTGLSGNNVVVEEQLLEASSASGQYRVATNLYRKAHEMMITVVTSR